ncbi:phosphoglycolate phosphatase [Solilutibacter tolerans]|uniref:phosphoglycolate phosphatase n=1 Tax=Solilutibacter tolerans TaxID=1604334 RepID=A0A1N6X2Q3_9GAMM|nr:phosphoglycolate phosphatase [Lysobacter tolerans]SIQ96628.1 phosphoglycolate phosphatase [Lysobacter tolerans]
MTSRTRFPEVALFDLDGTLLDSAPDMLATVNVMRERRDIAPMTLAEIRPVVSRGARAMAGTAFPAWSDEEIVAAVPEFLAIYAQELGQHCAPFEGIPALLEALEAQGSRWGIVTNKPEQLARDLMPMLGWDTRCGVLIGGDSLPERKPHPMPMFRAAEVMGAAPNDCVYVGDDRRDIDAARAAGMLSIAALWGYRVAGDEPSEWGADAMVALPADLLQPKEWP